MSENRRDTEWSGSLRLGEYSEGALYYGNKETGIKVATFESGLILSTGYYYHGTEGYEAGNEDSFRNVANEMLHVICDRESYD